MDCLRSLDGRLILVVQRSRHIARALASTLVAKGAQVVLAKVARLDLVDLPQLAAAVLNAHSHELCKLLEERKIPFRCVLRYHASAKGRHSGISSIIERRTPGQLHRDLVAADPDLRVDVLWDWNLAI